MAAPMLMARFGSVLRPPVYAELERCRASKGLNWQVLLARAAELGPHPRPQGSASQKPAGVIQSGVAAGKQGRDRPW